MRILNSNIIISSWRNRFIKRKVLGEKTDLLLSNIKKKNMFLKADEIRIYNLIKRTHKTLITAKILKIFLNISIFNVYYILIFEIENKFKHL